MFTLIIKYKLFYNKIINKHINCVAHIIADYLL